MSVEGACGEGVRTRGGNAAAGQCELERRLHLDLCRSSEGGQQRELYCYDACGLCRRRQGLCSALFSFPDAAYLILGPLCVGRWQWIDACEDE
jgi:hypothetical protein